MKRSAGYIESNSSSRRDSRSNGRSNSRSDSRSNSRSDSRSNSSSVIGCFNNNNEKKRCCVKENNSFKLRDAVEAYKRGDFDEDTPTVVDFSVDECDDTTARWDNKQEILAISPEANDAPFGLDTEEYNDNKQLAELLSMFV